MIRKKFEVQAPDIDLPYNIRLEQNTAQQIKSARKNSGDSWVPWVRSAIKRLRDESPVEIESLLRQAQLVTGSRKDKVSLPFRVNTADIDTVRALSAQYGARMQAVLIAAMHLYSFVSSMELPDEHGIEN